MTPLAYFNDIPLRYVGNIMPFYQGGRAAYFGKGGLPEGPQKEQEISSKGLHFMSIVLRLLSLSIKRNILL